MEYGHGRGAGYHGGRTVPAVRSHDYQVRAFRFYLVE
jgi:hypothetical protein